jgi:cysteine synthase B
VRQLARKHGLLVGISSGAAIAGALQLAEECAARGEESVIAVVLPDGADKYLSERFWEE